ncbi:hypothetical protein [Kitasatospora sp. CB01950]|uniref:hypothetical protein n=1 Tax=Kitasatospora sp. CB01950 TaxID=1703930 RepID=UPI00093C0010|nr:hypothetical protein [Kitasatospora sp. CB01950]OKJ15838.1 hypothetical protein AMK19_06270 [Kitasatospora sp. CB01950]
MVRRRLVAAALVLGAISLVSGCGSVAPTGGGISVEAAPSGGAGAGAGAGAVADADAAPPSDGSTPGAWQPANGAASALGDLGYGAFRDVYGSVYVDAGHNRVVLYATDTGRATSMIAAAREAHPDTAGVNVEIVACAYTARAMSEASGKIMSAQQAEPFSYPVYSSGNGPEGNGVLVTTSAAGAASPEFARELQRVAGSVPVRVSVGEPVADADAIRPVPSTSG